MTQILKTGGCPTTLIVQKHSKTINLRKYFEVIRFYINIMIRMSPHRHDIISLYINVHNINIFQTFELWSICLEKDIFSWILLFLRYKYSSQWDIFNPLINLVNNLKSRFLQNEGCCKYPYYSNHTAKLTKVF